MNYYRLRNSSTGFPHALVSKCFDSFFVNLDQLSDVTGFLGFAFQFSLLQIFVWICCVFKPHFFVGKQAFAIIVTLSHLQKLNEDLFVLHTPYLEILSSVFFSVMFFDCLNLRVLIATGHLLFREVSLNFHTQKIKKYCSSNKNVSKRLLFFILVNFS